MARNPFSAITNWLMGPQAADTRDASSARWWGGASQVALSGQLVTSETGLQLDVVGSVLDRLAGSISTLPIGIFERLDDNERRPAREHPLYKVLHIRPNRRQTAVEFFDEQQRHLAWWRNAYARIIPGDSPVDQLDPIHPSRLLKIERSADGWVYYTFKRLGNDAGQDTYREDEIFHVRKAPLTADGLMGRPVWETSRETLGRAQAVEQFGALYFANGGSGGGVLKHPGNFRSPGERDEFLAGWREGGTGLNRHRDRLLLFGLDYTPFSVNNDEAQFIETMKEMGSKLCRIWNMPPHLAGILDKATFSNIEQQSIEYVVHTLSPWIAAWEQAATRDLLIGDDQDRYFIEINVAGLLRGDIKARYDAYAVGRQWGWLSINDVRRLENLNPVECEEADDYLMPLNMIAIDDVVEPPEAPKTPEPGEPPEPDDSEED